MEKGEGRNKNVIKRDVKRDRKPLVKIPSYTQHTNQMDSMHLSIFVCFVPCAIVHLNLN